MSDAMPHINERLDGTRVEFPDAAYRIRDWDLYEPREKSGGTISPLKWVRLQVHGYELSLSYRKLADVAGRDLMAAVGLFVKLIEMAADQPRSCRDGTIRQKRNGGPATPEDISYATGFRVQEVRRCLQHLLHPDVRWIEVMPAGRSRRAGLQPQAGDGGENPAIAGNSGSSPATAATCGNMREIAQADEDETETETKTETKTDTKTASGSLSSEGESSDSASRITESQQPHQGVQRTTLARIMEILHLHTPQRGDKCPRAAQERADVTTIVRMIDHVVTATDRTSAKSQADRLIALAIDAAAPGKEKPIAWFIDRVKQEYPHLRFNSSDLSAGD